MHNNLGTVTGSSFHKKALLVWINSHCLTLVDNKFDLAKLPFSGLSEGFYVVGSGNTGVGTGLMALGGIYAAAIMGSAVTIKKPAPGFLPAGYTPPAGQGGMASVNVGNVMKVTNSAY